MDGGRPIRRDKLRLAHQAVSLWQSGTSLGEVARRLKCKKERVMRVLAPIERKEVPYDRTTS